MIQGDVAKFLMQDKHFWNCNKISFGREGYSIFIFCVEHMIILVGPTDQPPHDPPNIQMSAQMDTDTWCVLL